MQNTNTKELEGPEGTNDALTILLREGVHKLIMEAVEAEMNEHLSRYQDLKLYSARA